MHSRRPRLCASERDRIIGKIKRKSVGLPFKGRHKSCQLCRPFLRNSRLPRVHDRLRQPAKVRGVSRDERQMMDFRCCRKECIHRVARPALPVATRHSFSPGVGNRIVDRENAAFKSRWQLLLQPVFQPGPAPTRRQALRTIAQLSQCDHANESAILIDRLTPRNETRIRSRLDPF